MRIGCGAITWEWCPDRRLLLVDHYVRREVVAGVYQGGAAIRELREAGQDLINVSVKLEKMAVLIETGNKWWGE